MDSATRPVDGDDHARLVRMGFGTAVLRREPRRHPVCFRDTVPPGFPNGVDLGAARVERALARLSGKPARALKIVCPPAVASPRELDGPSFEPQSQRRAGRGKE